MISKFVTAETTDITNFYNWLVEYKNDSFLESIDISLDNGYITFLKNSVSIRFALGINSWYYNNGVFSFEWYIGGGNRNPIVLLGALINNGGLIIRFKIDNAVLYLPLFFDNNNELSMAKWFDFIYTTVAYYKTALITSNTAFDNPSTIQPSLSNSYTSLCSLIPGGSEPILADNFYLATYTQVDNLGLYIADFNGDKYITNGYYFIKGD